MFSVRLDCVFCEFLQPSPPEGFFAWSNHRQQQATLQHLILTRTCSPSWRWLFPVEPAWPACWIVRAFMSVTDALSCFVFDITVTRVFLDYPAHDRCHIAYRTGRMPGE